MVDREKVIKSLRVCSVAKCCIDCPYVTLGIECVEALHLDVLELLKEQEPRTPHYTRLEYLVNGRVVEVYHPECPRCFENGLFLWDAEIEEGQAYCKRCGQAVKWE